jgi:alcohol dehydrogenase (NADP+)
VKIARALGAEVSVLSTSENKRQDALGLGAHDFAATRDPETFKSLARSFDFIIDTVSAPHDYNAYLSLLKTDGTMVLLGVPDQPAALHSGSLIMQRRRLAGSLIGGIRETQEMLDFCASNGIASDIELIAIDQVNEAYERMVRGDVRYRFVIDIASLDAMS